MGKAYVNSPFGTLEITSSEKGISQITLTDVQNSHDSDEFLRTAISELENYFKGKLIEFSVPLDLSSGTTFQKKVWNALLEIPYGNTKSYLDIARILGDEKAVRAVGTANGQNPVMIIVPCHRVIGSNGSLIGYAHGLDVKRKLLALENPRAYALNGTLF